MECGIEARDRRNLSCEISDDVDEAQRGWLMKRCEWRQRGKLTSHLSIEPYRFTEHRSAVYDAMPDGVEVTERLEAGTESGFVGDIGRGQVGSFGDALVVGDDLQLEAARAGVHGESSHVYRNPKADAAAISLRNIAPLQAGNVESLCEQWGMSALS